jgi:hypothetical protein
MLSVVAGIAASGCVAYLAARRTKRWSAGVFAAVLFLALGFGGVTYSFPPWFALYKGDALGLALSLAAVVVVWGGSSPRRALLAGALAALAILTKQTFVAAALAGAICLWRRDHQSGVVFVVTVASIVLSCLVGFQVATGALVANTLSANANPLGWSALSFNLIFLTLSQAGPALAAAAFLGSARRRRSSEDDLLVVYWAATLLPLLGLTKVGSNYNYWMEFAAITAVLAAAAVWWACEPSPNGRAIRFGAALSLALWLHVAVVSPLIITALAVRVRHLPAAAAIPAGTTTFADLVERVRAEPRQVLANPADVVVLAERPLLFEPYVFSILEREGQWDPAALVEQICVGGIGLLVVDSPLESAGPSFHGYSHWPAPVLDALRQTMVLEARYGDRLLYVPARREAGGELGTACGGRGERVD